MTLLQQSERLQAENENLYEQILEEHQAMMAEDAGDIVTNDAIESLKKELRELRNLNKPEKSNVRI